MVAFWQGVVRSGASLQLDTQNRAHRDMAPAARRTQTLQPNEFWMTEFYADYVDLRKAVVQLESIVHCDSTSRQSGRPFLRGAQVAEPVSAGGGPPPPKFPRSSR